MTYEKEYAVADNDLLFPGISIKLHHILSHKEYDISDLVQKSLEEVRALYERSFLKEESIYQVLQAGMKAWEREAIQTYRLQLAISYLEVKPVEHTGNRWLEDEKGMRTISNLVYKMTCLISENTKWDVWSAKPLNDRWTVDWSVALNIPLSHRSCVIAGRRRSFFDRLDAENYLGGRIKAYSKLFTEVSPPIPDDKKQYFMLNGLLLPGYRLEADEPKQDKDSVLDKLSEAKTKPKVVTAMPVKEKKEPEI